MTETGLTASQTVGPYLSIGLLRELVTTELVDPADARELSRHTKPEIDEHDLAHLDVYTATARLLVGNREFPAFTFVTHPPAAPDGEPTAIRQACAAATTPAGEEPPMQQLARTAMKRRMADRDR